MKVMVEIRFDDEIILFPHKTEVWLKEKGLAHEDELAPTQDTLENLQKECYAQFGRKITKNLFRLIFYLNQHPKRN